MRRFFTLGALAALALAATDPSDAELEKELAAWEASPNGQYAKQLGLVPKTESITGQSDTSEKLRRWKAKKAMLPIYAARNPHASFTMNTPFALVTKDEANGYPALAIDYAARNGVCLLKDYPYISGGDGTVHDCVSSCTKQNVNVDTYVYVYGESSYLSVMQAQPVAVFLYAGEEFMAYKGGILSHCSNQDDATTDHLIVAVATGRLGRTYCWLYSIVFAMLDSTNKHRLLWLRHQIDATRIGGSLLR
ncbi:unnamed protein product [Aphanomyces euteiches]